MLGTQHHMHNTYALSFLEERGSLSGFTYLAANGRVKLLWKGQQLCCPPESSSMPLLLRRYLWLKTQSVDMFSHIIWDNIKVLDALLVLAEACGVLHSSQSTSCSSELHRDLNAQQGNW